MSPVCEPAKNSGGSACLGVSSPTDQRAGLGVRLALAAVSCAAVLLCAWPAEARRVALVIGNANYTGGEIPALRNPSNDATDMAAALKRLGFEIVLGKPLIDAGRADMDRAVYEFGAALRGAEVGLFYYAGHGMQIDGSNYLVPSDLVADSEGEVAADALDLNRVLARMEADTKGRVNLVILDACRNNPFARRFRTSGGNGLAAVDAPARTLIAYATAPGSTAADGDGRNGAFTAALLAELANPKDKIWEMLSRAGERVQEQTDSKQIPWVASSPGAGNLVLGKLESNPSPLPVPVPPSPPSQPAPSAQPSPPASGGVQDPVSMLPAELTCADIDSFLAFRSRTGKLPGWFDAFAEAEDRKEDGSLRSNASLSYYRRGEPLPNVLRSAGGLIIGNVDLYESNIYLRFEFAESGYHTSEEAKAAITELVEWVRRCALPGAIESADGNVGLSFVGYYDGGRRMNPYVRWRFSTRNRNAMLLVRPYSMSPGERIPPQVDVVEFLVRDL